MIRNITISILFLFIITACSSIQTVTSAPPAEPTLPGGGGSAPPQAAPSPTAHLSLPPEPAEPIWLRIITPIDQAVVNTPQIEVAGEAPAGAVISIDDQILIVGADSRFSAMVTLDEGPNLIEIVASDVLGNELTMEIIVIYEP